jgi:hypothetical protein
MVTLKFVGMLGAVVAALSAAPALADPAEVPSADWCKLDAPGVYRGLVAEARAKGTREIGACPATEAPETLPERLVVPLPCGRHLEMRRIDVPVSRFIDHFVSNVGGAPDGAGIITQFAQGNREDVLSGTFSRALDEAGGGPAIGYGNLGYRAFYLASHEWTQLQHDLYTSGALQLWSDPNAQPDTAQSVAVCAGIQARAEQLSHRDILPKGGLSWYDVQAVAGALNDYIMAESRRRLEAERDVLVPWEQGSSGFFRLPSEVEWEYGAFGGAPGTIDLTATHLIRTADGQIVSPELSQIAALSEGRGTEHLRAVGSLVPNLAGLYDTVGNVAEMTHDLFSIIRPDSRHGGRGGVVLRGGNALTPRSVIGVGHREELPLHTFEGAGRAVFGGVRWMLAAPILPRGYDPSGERATDLQNIDLTKLLESENALLTAIRETPGASFRREAERLLAALQEDVDSADGLDTERVASVRRALQQSEAALNTAQEAALAARIRSAADSVYALRSLSAIIITWHEKLDEAEVVVRTEFPAEEHPAAFARIEAGRENVFRRASIIDIQIRELQRMLTGLAQSDSDLVTRLFVAEAEHLRQAGIGMYDEFLIWERLQVGIERIRSQPNQDHFTWLRDEFDVFRDDRISIWGER